MNLIFPQNFMKGKQCHMTKYVKNVFILTVDMLLNSQTSGTIPYICSHKKLKKVSVSDIVYKKRDQTNESHMMIYDI